MRLVSLDDLIGEGLRLNQEKDRVLLEINVLKHSLVKSYKELNNIENQLKETDKDLNIFRKLEKKN